MGASCNDQRKAVAICLQRSPCVLIERNTPKKCLEDPELSKDLPELCMAQMKAFLECKRGMVDMTKRFRGNGAMSTGKYDQQYEKLSNGDFDAREELHKLETLSNVSKN
ncbi:LAFA_0G16358g1_1 [Lachancea sp. 'fantastica']|nr:LAFA_0G16358g1_1 [Lachancea sp. 'fantastica']